MNNWKEVRLADIMDIISGGTPKTTNPEYWNGGIPWLSVVDFNNVCKYVYKTEKTISKQGLDNSSTKYLNAGDIIISARGTVGALAVLDRPMTLNQSCYGLRGKVGVVYNDFLYYLLKHSLTQIESHTYGAVFDTITKQTFENIFVRIPLWPEQLDIAEVLSSLDDKINLLNRNNRTLEALAETLFRQWFLKEADNNWEDTKLGRHINSVSGYSYRSVDLQPSGNALVTLKSFDRNGGFKQDGFKEYIGKYKDDQVVVNGDLVVAHTDLTQEAEVLGNPAIVISTNKYEKLIISTDLVKVVPISYLSKPYLYFMMKSDDFKHYCLGASNGTTVLHLSKAALPNYEFKLPPESLVKKFTNAVEPMFDKLTQNQIQIAKLEQLRDSLLPKLMSGALTIKALEDELVCS